MKQNLRRLIPGAFWMLAILFSQEIWIVIGGFIFVGCLILGKQKDMRHLAEVGLLLCIWSVLGLSCNLTFGVAGLKLNALLFLGGVASATLFTKEEWKEIVEKIK